MTDENDSHDSFDDTLGEALREQRPRAPFPEAEIQGRIRETLEARRSEAGAGTSPGRLGASRGGDAWWRGPNARAALAAAAALVLFIGGMEYGRRTATAGAGPVALPPTGELVRTVDPISPGGRAGLPLSIQTAGSQYVASLARFNGESASLSQEQRLMGREVALAVLYGATLELLRESGDDEILQAVIELVSERRQELYQGDPAPSRF